MIFHYPIVAVRGGNGGKHIEGLRGSEAQVFEPTRRRSRLGQMVFEAILASEP